MTGESFWMVWNESGHMPRMKHSSAESAVKEAKRLALLNPGQTFHVLVATDAYIKDDVRHIRLEAEMSF